MWALTLLSKAGPLLIANWKLIVAGLAAIVLAWFVWSWSARGAEIKDLQRANAALAEEVSTAKTRLEQAEAATQRLEQRIAERDATQSGVSQVQEDIARAPEEEDGAVAPVLRDALDGIRRLRGAGQDPARAP